MLQGAALGDGEDEFSRGPRPTVISPSRTLFSGEAASDGPARGSGSGEMLASLEEEAEAEENDVRWSFLIS